MSFTNRVNGGCPDCVDPLTDNPIRASIGAGGRNRTADVLAIRQFLNAPSPAEGESDLILPKDGRIGPNTQAAITKYQNQTLGWADGRIDPSGPTIRALTQYTCDSPTFPCEKLGSPQSGSRGVGAQNTAPPPALWAPIASRKLIFACARWSSASTRYAGS
jgi:hypothetical protein